ncbi:hypothetical protein GB931_14425 [Modestobacter sp. I12A-02628]|uniref:Uncharacterized protein n=1 Tax=Goekera deserti TaxID=2497753 RepID=A0A7K3WJR8_9ACTN|nr:hypothetical protein [Goekera deserti]MPQ99095.1 hypothetical protein [Goekera deserti]NDI47429.1 hypothetical protein [Goekera deserti]NEL55960.1 hypothetical protein [Goekera deserti]
MTRAGRAGLATELAAARARVVSAGAPRDGREALTLARGGWTAEAYWSIAELGQHAADVGALVAYRVEHPGRRSRREQPAARYAVNRLIVDAEQATLGGAPLRTAVWGWLELLAVEARDWPLVEQVHRHLQGWSAEARELLATVGPLAPLTRLAGMDDAEARSLAAAGMLDEPGLRLLAGLRGYRLP